MATARESTAPTSAGGVHCVQSRQRMGCGHRTLHRQPDEALHRWRRRFTQAGLQSLCPEAFSGSGKGLTCRQGRPLNGLLPPRDENNDNDET
jgi:hypothetical protein